MSRTITREQYVKACVAFLDALGENPRGAYFPAHLDVDKITFPRVPVAAGDRRHVRATAMGYDGDPSDVLSIVTTIQVVDE